MNEAWQLAAVGGVLVPILGGMIAYMLRTRSLLTEVKDELHAHKVYALERFATNKELQEAEKRLTAHLERIEDYLKSLVGEIRGHPCAPARPHD